MIYLFASDFCYRRYQEQRKQSHLHYLKTRKQLHIKRLQRLQENQEAVKHQLSDSVKEWDMMDILL